jgi:hypothetical protein
VCLPGNVAPFEDRLWNALKHEAARPENELPADCFQARPARRAVTARRAGLGLSAAAAVGAILPVVPGGGSTPAYAVETQKGGTVKITIHDALKVIHNRPRMEALETKLRVAGINVVVDASAPYLCQIKDGHLASLRKPPGLPGHILVLGTVSSIVTNPSGTILDGTLLLHRGNTAWIESGPSGKGGRLYGIAFLHATCAPAHGGR